jgi:hypothetical protein
MVKVIESGDGWMVDSNIDPYGDAAGTSVMLHIAGKLICLTDTEARQIGTALIAHADEAIHGRSK